MKWCLGLEKSTPSYMVLGEVKRDKMRIVTEKRAMLYEDNIKQANRKWMVKECLREKANGRVRTRGETEKEKFYQRNGYSQLGLRQLGEVGDSRKVDIIKRRGQEVQGQEQYNRIQVSTYNDGINILELE